ncbi:7-cyano-7-deazaguanine synthase [Candidatus Pacearchaeota archaeon]|nr:7-cyano-7-deazaguanine synthase [Candidatus Pacearchaeota archaeon]
MGNAIILASGGLDSYVLSWYVKNTLKKEVRLIFFDYGQKALKEELFCVKQLAREMNCELKIVNLDFLGEISTSLINKNESNSKEDIINWYVPCRNTIFLSIALAYAESLFIGKKEENDVYIGIKFEGEIRFNDTTKEYIEEMNKLAKSCTQVGEYEVFAPFIDKDKEELIQLGKKMGLKLEKSYSCYLGAGFKEIVNDKTPIHCGKCAGCLARKKGFKFSEVEDKSLYCE